MHHYWARKLLLIWCCAHRSLTIVTSALTLRTGEKPITPVRARHWVKPGLLLQESRINTRNVNVCGGEKDVLKYTFIQSLCEIKQQNWSTLPSSPALLRSLNSLISPHIDFPRRPSPWRLQAGPLSPLLGPEYRYQEKRFGLTASG